MMEWSQLVSERRLRRAPDEAQRVGRSPFQQDADLIVFSAAFRRLQDKTQVQPLSEGGRARTRLTHSIEVASVGRSLGTLAAEGLRERRRAGAAALAGISQIVHAACLAHDIGNPPFGHGGEEAIQGWFQRRPELLVGLSAGEAEDLRRFDGNAQGLRTLTQLENYRLDGGLRLTHATLASLLKYVTASHECGPARSAAQKPGFFQAEAAYVAELRESLGVPPATRHPLVYLTEAADDICYAIVDLEDGYDAGLLEHGEAVDVLSELAGVGPDRRLERDEQLHKLRGVAIGRLVAAAAAAFLDHEAALLAGRGPEELLRETAQGAAVERAKTLARERLFGAPSVVERLIGGQRVLTGLLDTLAPVVAALEAVGFEREALRGDAATLVKLLGPRYAPRTRYEALLGLTDYVSALTDRAAISLAGRLSGRGLA